MKKYLPYVIGGVITLAIVCSYFIGKQNAEKLIDNQSNTQVLTDSAISNTNSEASATPVSAPTNSPSTNVAKLPLQPKTKATNTVEVTDNASCLSHAQQQAKNHEADGRGTFGYTVLKANFTGYTCYYEFAYSSRDSNGPTNLRVIYYWPGDTYYASCVYSATNPTQCFWGAAPTQIITEEKFKTMETSFLP